CLSFCFVMAKRLKGYAFILIADTAVGIAVAILGTKFFGLVGYIAFTALYGLMGLGFWYITLKGPRLFGLGCGRLFRQSALPCALYGALFAASLALFQEAGRHLLEAEIGVVIAGTGLFAALFWKDMQATAAYVRGLLAKRRAQRLETAAAP
ncbi:MAG: hypothetical protein PHQ12_09775, partial [Chthoniobacteraceae bacterium]|nr:hypothetical protein [Chthoniobacteraceae bacterium]